MFPYVLPSLDLKFLEVGLCDKHPCIFSAQHEAPVSHGDSEHAAFIRPIKVEHYLGFLTPSKPDTPSNEIFSCVRLSFGPQSYFVR